MDPTQPMLATGLDFGDGLEVMLAAPDMASLTAGWKAVMGTAPLDLALVQRVTIADATNSENPEPYKPRFVSRRTRP